MKLYKKTEGKVIAGVCSGLAEAAGMEVKWMRLIWVVGALVTVTIIPVIVAYVVLAILLPDNADGTQAVPSGKIGIISFAAFLIALGVLIVLDSLIPFALTKFFLPICLIGGGVLVIVWAIKKGK